jgi:hypothetical protein
MLDSQRRDAALAKHLDNRSLIEMMSLFTRDETARTMIVSPDIMTIITPPFDDTEQGKRCGEFRAWLDDFIEGCEITVAENPFDKPLDVMLARVDPLEAEFWSIRVTEPEDTPGLRGLGAFAEKDKFIALTWDYRELIGADFDDEVDSVREEWRSYTPTP